MTQAEIAAIKKACEFSPSRVSLKTQMDGMNWKIEALTRSIQVLINELDAVGGIVSEIEEPSKKVWIENERKKHVVNRKCRDVVEKG